MIKLAADSNVGLIRHNNEDNYILSTDLSFSEWHSFQKSPYVSPLVKTSKYGALLVVADGMGGANAGEVASAIAVETIQQQFTPDILRETVYDDQSALEFMKAVVSQADLNIVQRSKVDPSALGMGTTIVMAWILGDKAYICWSGDSRCYVFNEINGLVQLSKDHSYVQQLVDRGELEKELMHNHPLSNIITRCLGDPDHGARPEARIYQLHDGDIIMLCSDGLNGICKDRQICDTMAQYSETLATCMGKLIEAALSGGGYDNVTVALAHVHLI